MSTDVLTDILVDAVEQSPCADHPDCKVQFTTHRWWADVTHQGEHQCNGLCGPHLISGESLRELTRASVVEAVQRWLQHFHTQPAVG